MIKPTETRFLSSLWTIPIYQSNISLSHLAHHNNTPNSNPTYIISIITKQNKQKKKPPFKNIKTKTLTLTKTKKHLIYL